MRGKKALIVLIKAIYEKINVNTHNLADCRDPFVLELGKI